MEKERGVSPEGGSARSSASNVWIFKIWAPLLWLIWGVALFRHDIFSVRILGCIPFVLALIFHLSLAIVRIRDGRIRYRMLFSWSVVELRDVISSGVVWPPFIGYVRLRHSQPPWGRMFFLLDSGSGRRSAQQKGYGILGYLHRAHELVPVSISPAGGRDIRYGRLILAWACGILASFIRVFLSSAIAPDGNGSVTYHSHLIEAALRALSVIGSPQLAIPLLAAFALLTAFFRDRQSAWSFAFLAGVVTPFALYPGLTR